MSIPRTLNAYLKNIYITLCGLPLKLIVLSNVLCNALYTAYNLMLPMHIYCLFLVSGWWAGCTKNTNENFVLRCCARALRHSSRLASRLLHVLCVIFQSVARLQSLLCMQTTLRPSRPSQRSSLFEHCASPHIAHYIRLLCLTLAARRFQCIKVFRSDNI